MTKEMKPFCFKRMFLERGRRDSNESGGVADSEADAPATDR